MSCTHILMCSRPPLLIQRYRRTFKDRVCILGEVLPATSHHALATPTAPPVPAPVPWFRCTPSWPVLLGPYLSPWLGCSLRPRRSPSDPLLPLAWPLPVAWPVPFSMVIIPGFGCPHGLAPRHPWRPCYFWSGCSLPPAEVDQGACGPQACCPRLQVCCSPQVRQHRSMTASQHDSIAAAAGRQPRSSRNCTAQ